MKKLLMVSFLAVAALGTTQVYAYCAMQAVVSAPKIPAPEQSSFEQTLALRDAVETYISKAESRLQSCDSYTDAFVYNLAVQKINDVAEQFNTLARHHNQTLVSAL